MMSCRNGCAMINKSASKISCKDSILRHKIKDKARMAHCRDQTTVYDFNSFLRKKLRFKLNSAFRAIATCFKFNNLPTIHIRQNNNSRTLFLSLSNVDDITKK